MATMTISVSSKTFVSNAWQSSDFSMVPHPRTDRYFRNITINNFSGWDNATKYGSRVTTEGAILRFERPVALKYSKITSATLHLVISSIHGENYETSVKNTWAVATYTTDKALSALSWSNFRQGVLGEWVVGGNGSTSPGPVSYDIGITSLYNGDLSASEFTLVISAGEWYSSIDIGQNRVEAQDCYLSVTYEPATQPAPTPLYPRDVTVIESPTTLFSWQFNSETEAVQTAATLQYKNVEDPDYTTISLTQPDFTYTLNQTLPVGSYQWRVKVTNEAGTTSNYSDVAYFNVVGRPASPIINEPANKTLTTITWNTMNQQACEIILADQNGRELYHETLATSETVYKPNFFLNGQYMFSVRVMNESMLWSDWGQRAFTISAAGPDAATIALSPVAGSNAVNLAFTIPADVNAALMRSHGSEEKVIALLGDIIETYSDDTVSANETYTYWIRTYVDGYTDSTTVQTSVNYVGAIFGSDDISLNLSESDEKFLPHSESIAREFATFNLSGREYPLVERGEFTTIEITRRFRVTPAQKKILDALTKKESLFYRDSKGNAFSAAIKSIQYEVFMNDGYMSTISLIRLNDEEVIINV